MKSAVYTVCFLIPLAILFVVIERKDIYSDVEAVVLAEAVTKEKTATVVETESSPISATAASFIEMNSDMDTRTDEASVSSVSRTMPVVTPEESRGLSGEATSFQNSNKVKPVPVAIPVLTPEEAVKANKEAIRFYRGIVLAQSFNSFLSKIANKKHCLFFIVALLPLLFIFDILPLKRKRKNSRNLKDYFSASRRVSIFCSVSLLAFGVTAFVPWSVYFGNSLQFSFIFNDFINFNLLVLTLTIISVCIVLLLIPPIISDYIVAAITGLGLCVYVQAMFMNQHLGTMDGIEPIWSEHRLFGTINLIVWIIVFLSFIVLKILVSKYFFKIISVVAGIVLFLEIVAVSSILLSSSSDVWIRTTDDYFIDGSEQFQFSKQKNVVAFIMDNLASSYIETCFEKYPEAKDVVKDFIYYADARSNYHMTFPGLIHELTGSFLRAPAENFFDLQNKMWNSPSAKSFYKQLNDSGYSVRFYLNVRQFIIGPESCYHDYFSNIEPKDITYIIDYKRVLSCLKLMSGYSCAPYFLKKYFFYTFDFSDDIVQKQVGDIITKKIPNTNSDYLNALQLSGISSDAKKPVFSFHYTTGAHLPWIHDEKCIKRDKKFDNPVPTTRGCFYLLSEFIRFLKEANIYDNTAIFLFSDHGGNSKGNGDGKYDMSFMIKPFNENKPELTIDMTKVQSIDILPTLLYLACGEKADFTDFDGFAPNSIPDARVRTVYAFYGDRSLPPVDRDFNRCYPGIQGLREYIFNDLKTFKLGKKSESFVREFPLIISSQEENASK